MPVCKHCGVRISKFDTDRCPICGELNPLKDVKSDTIEVTSEINMINDQNLAYEPVKRSTFLLLSILLGWTGINWFYAKLKKPGLIWLIAHLVFLGGLFALLFVLSHNILISILVPFGVAYVINTIMGILIHINPNFKDGHGNLLK